jgi:hypothetical protein
MTVTRFDTCNPHDCRSVHVPIHGMDQSKPIIASGCENASGCERRTIRAGPEPSHDPLNHSTSPHPRCEVRARQSNRTRQSRMIRWSSGTAESTRTWGDARGLASRARTEWLLLDAKSAARLRHKLALMDIAAQHIAGHRSHFNPNQPRVPAGNPDGGQWTSTNGGIGSRLAAAEKPRLGRRTAIPLVLEAAKRLIKAYRSEHGLWDLFERKEGTVAFTELDGIKVFGSNSTSPAYTSADEAAAIRLRNILVEKYPKKFRAEHVGQMPNAALFHAETTVLLRAVRQAGGTLAGRTLTVHVDGKLCNNCEAVLPYVGLELGNPTVTFIDPKGLTNTVRDGAWTRSSK